MFPTHAQRVEVAQAVLQVLTATSAELGPLLSQPLPHDSPGASLLQRTSIEDTPLIDLGAHLAVAVDHLGALTLPLSAEEDFGPSIATLARGAIEACARGWWLLTGADDEGTLKSTSPEALEARSLALQFSEMRRAKAGSLIRVADGEVLTAAALREQKQQRLAELVETVGPTRFPGAMDSVIGLLAGLGVDRDMAESYYSQLSDAAHAQTTGLFAFAKAVGDDGTAFTNAVSSPLLAHIADFSCVALTVLGRAYASLWGAEQMSRYTQSTAPQLDVIRELSSALLRGADHASSDGQDGPAGG